MAVIGIGADRTAPVGVRSSSLKQLLLHSIAILLEAFVVASTFGRRVKKVEPLQDIVCKRMTPRSLPERFSWPAFTLLQARIQFAKTSYELTLLLLKHFDVAFRIYLVLRLFTFPKHTNGIVSLTATAWAGAVTFGLLQTTTITGFANPLSYVVLGLN